MLEFGATYADICRIIQDILNISGNAEMMRLFASFNPMSHGLISGDSQEMNREDAGIQDAP